MVVGLLEIHIHLHAIPSLKAKRSIVKSLIARLRNKFNLAAAEVGAQDSKRMAIIGVSIISTDGKHANSQLDNIINFITLEPGYFTGTINREVFPFKG